MSLLREGHPVAAREPISIPAPLVVDLDGTLTPTDTLLESIVCVLKHKPWEALKFPFWLLKGRAAFKGHLAARCELPVKDLPYRLPLVEYLQSEKKKGRRVILATAAHEDIANAVAMRLGLFDDVLATDATQNLTGTRKLKAIQERVGPRFVYAANDSSDLPIWQAAEGAILVGVPRGLARVVRRKTPIEHEFPQQGVHIGLWLRALRVHQWLKNFLVFVPILTTFSFLQADKLATTALAFIAFCFAASGSYIFNDLLDLQSDRVHPRKRDRPLASGRLPIKAAMGGAVVLLIAALAIAAGISQAFLLMLVLYLLLTSLYSLTLKQYVLIDVLTLSLLYTLRILAGAVALGVATSSWLLAFSVFIFFSLALVKRCSELVSLAQIGSGATHGRDYRVSDLTVLWPLGVGSALCAVVIFGLFISAEETRVRYATPEVLWLVAMGLIYWLSRLLLKSARGEMHDDPLVFAVRDFGSLVTVSGMIAAVILAHFVALGMP